MGPIYLWKQFRRIDFDQRNKENDLSWDTDNVTWHSHKILFAFAKRSFSQLIHVKTALSSGFININSTSAGDRKIQNFIFLSENLIWDFHSVFFLLV